MTLKNIIGTIIAKLIHVCSYLQRRENNYNSNNNNNNIKKDSKNDLIETTYL